MKRKVALIQIVMILGFVGLVILSYFRNQVRHVDWKDVLKKDYDLEVIELIGSFDVDIEQSLTLNLPGFNASGMIFDLMDAPTKHRPDQGIMVNYVLTNDGEKLIYSYPYILWKQKPKDFVHVVDQPQDLTIGDFLEELSEWPEYQDISDEIASHNFFMTHSYDTSMHGVSHLFHEFMEEYLQGVLFFELTNEDAIFFSYNNEAYVLVRMNDSYVFILPEVMTFDQFMQRVMGI